MNTQTRKTLTRFALIGALLGTTVPAQAQDLEFSALMAAKVGRIIASQGNAALINIREELKSSIGATFRPFLPSADELGVIRTGNGPVVADEFAAPRGSI